MSEHIKEWSNDDPHVPLQFNEDGLVTRIGHDMGGSYEYKDKPTSDDYEVCIICGKLTNILKQTHIDYRYGYVEGAGQCCKECYDRTNEESSEDYEKRVMKFRTTLVTMTAEEINDTPNNSELGAKLRKKMWEVLDFKNQYSKDMGWIFESPDNGETIYKRRIGETKRTLSNKEELFENTSARWMKDSEGFETDEWKCSICGKSTNDVEYDYLVGTDHLSCKLNKE